MKVKIFENEDFTLQYEKFYGEYYIHCSVRNWKKSSFKKGLEVFIKFRNYLKERKGKNTVYAYLVNGKFAKISGGVYMETLHSNGKIYERYKWETL